MLPVVWGRRDSLEIAPSVVKDSDSWGYVLVTVSTVIFSLKEVCNGVERS